MESRTPRVGNVPELRWWREVSNKQSTEIQVAFSWSDSFFLFYRPASLLPCPHWDTWWLKIDMSCNCNHLQRQTSCPWISVSNSLEMCIWGFNLHLLIYSVQSTVSREMESHDPWLYRPTLWVRTALRAGTASDGAGQTLQRISMTSILGSFKARDQVSLMFLSLALCILFCAYLINIDTFLVNK